MLSVVCVCLCAYVFVCMCVCVCMQRRRRLWARWARVPPPLTFYPKCPPPPYLKFYGHVAVTGRLRNSLRRSIIIQHNETHTVKLILA